MNELHIVAGPPASGKSVYGMKLAGELKAALLDIDTATERVVQAGLVAAGKSPDDRDSPDFKARFREPIYETLFEVAKENLPHISVVIVGPFTKEFREPDWLSELSAKIGTATFAHYVTANAETRKRRMEHRACARDIPKLNDWERYLSYYQEDARPPFEHSFLDTSNLG